MRVTKTKIETMSEVGVTNDYHRKVRLTLKKEFVRDSGNLQNDVHMDFTRAETTALIRALRRQRDRKGVK